jgi:hypothetical protein
MRKVETFEFDRRSWADAAERRILRKARQQPNKACVKRVLNLLTLMRESEELRLQIYERGVRLEKGDASDIHSSWRFGEKSGDAELDALVTTCHDRLSSITKLGKRYNWSPTLRAGGFDNLTRMFTWSKRSDDEVWENWAVDWLTRHAETSGLSPSRILRFRQCRLCSQWFYAMTDHQLHCSSACRQKFHANSPDFKARRARYMRERYRPQEKERELKAKADARRKK